MIARPGRHHLLAATLFLAAPTLAVADTNPENENSEYVTTHWNELANQIEPQAAGDSPHVSGALFANHDDLFLSTSPYAPGSCYYVYPDDPDSTSFLVPDVDHYVGTRYALNRITNGQRDGWSDSFYTATGVPVRFLNHPDSVVRDGSATFIQILVNQQLQLDPTDEGAVYHTVLPVGFDPANSHPVIVKNDYDTNGQILFGVDDPFGDMGSLGELGKMVGLSTTDGSAGAIGMLWNGGASLAGFHWNAKAYEQFEAVLDELAAFVGADKDRILMLGNSRAGQAALQLAANPFDYDYTVLAVAASSAVVRLSSFQYATNNPYPSVTYYWNLRYLTVASGFHDSWRPEWLYPENDGMNFVYSGGAKVNEHLSNPQDGIPRPYNPAETAYFVTTGLDRSTLDDDQFPFWMQFNRGSIDKLAKMGTLVHLEIGTHDFLPQADALSYAKALEAAYAAAGTSDSLRVEVLVRHGHLQRHIDEGANDSRYAGSQFIYDALAQIVAFETPTIESGRFYYRLDRQTLRGIDITSQVEANGYPFTVDLPPLLTHHPNELNRSPIVLTGEPGTQFWLAVVDTTGQQRNSLLGTIPNDERQSYIHDFVLPASLEPGLYFYVLAIQKRGGQPQIVNQTMNGLPLPLTLFVVDELADVTGMPSITGEELQNFLDTTFNRLPANPLTTHGYSEY